MPNRKRDSLQGQTAKQGLPASTIFTDDWPAYRGLEDHYQGHHRIRHSEEIYVDGGDIHTQTIEGLFGNLKTSLSGTYHAVSTKWLQGYLNEFTFRYNHREDERPIFRLILDRVASASPA